MTFLGKVALAEQLPTPGLRRHDGLVQSRPEQGTQARLLRLEVLIADAKFLPSIAHQQAQLFDRQCAHLMHANQQRRRHW